MKARLEAARCGFAPAAGLGGVVLGLAVLAAWWGNLPALHSPIPGAPAMKPNTALLFALCGVALSLRGRPDPTPRQAGAGFAVALVALGVAGATLIQHVLGVDLRIDRLLASASPGPTSPNTASAFLALSFALLMPRAADRHRAALVEALTLLVATSAMLVLLGYSLGLVFFAAPGPLPSAIGMAPHSAAGLLLLAVGVLVARREAVLTVLLASKASGGEMARRMLLVALVTIPTTTLAAFELQELGWWPSPGAAVVAATTSAMVLVLALRTTGRRLDAVESERTRLAAELGRALAESARASELFAEVARANFVVADATAAMPETGLSRVLEVIAEQARKLTGAELAGVGLGEQVPFESWVHVGAAAEQVRAGHPLLTAAAQLGESLRVTDVREDPRFRDLVPEQLQVTSFMTMPVTYRDRVTGHMCLANKQAGAAFTDRDQRAVELLAAHVGPAIEASRLYEREAILRARLESIVEHLPVGVVVVDAKAQLVLQNQASLDLAKSLDPVVHDVRSPSGEPLPVEAFPVMRALRDGERIASEELLLELGSGERVPILASAAPVRSGDEIVGAVAAFRDIRALKELERLREEWASVIAHDMRQPVNNIWLNGDLLRRASLSESAQNQVARIRRSAERLTRMIEDLLDISQVESRHLALRLVPLRLGTVLEEALAGVPAISERCQLYVEDAELRVLADPVRVIQILENLLSNAEKYGETSTPVVVRARREQNHVVISVENRGPGILPDELRTLFARFSRAPSVHGSAVRGLGLGLYICRGLVEAHGGRIWVESVPGGTTKFHFTLPVVLAETTVQASGPPTAARASSDLC